jgi:tetratricopeptide (TPR) repeat protein
MKQKYPAVITQINKKIIPCAPGQYIEFAEYFNVEYLGESLQLKITGWDWLHKSAALRHQKRYGEAMVCSDHVLQTNPEFQYEAWNHKGLVLQAQDQHDEAIKCFNEALEYDYFYTEALENKGISLQAQGRDTEAKTCFDQIPKTEAEYKPKGTILESLSVKRPSRYAQALLINPNDEATLISGGREFCGQRQYAEAMKCFNRALQINPKNKSALIGKGSTLHGQRQYPEAIECFDQALMIMLPKTANSMILCFKAEALYAQGEYAQALGCYNWALRLNPKSETVQRCKEKLFKTIFLKNKIIEALAQQTENRQIFLHVSNSNDSSNNNNFASSANPQILPPKQITRIPQQAHTGVAVATSPAKPMQVAPTSHQIVQSRLNNPSSLTAEKLVEQGNVGLLKKEPQKTHRSFKEKLEQLQQEIENIKQRHQKKSSHSRDSSAMFKKRRLEPKLAEKTDYAPSFQGPQR